MFFAISYQYMSFRHNFKNQKFQRTPCTCIDYMRMQWLHTYELIKRILMHMLHKRCAKIVFPVFILNLKLTDTVTNYII